MVIFVGIYNTARGIFGVTLRIIGKFIRRFKLKSLDIAFDAIITASDPPKFTDSKWKNFKGTLYGQRIYNILKAVFYDKGAKIKYQKRAQPYPLLEGQKYVRLEFSLKVSAKFAEWCVYLSNFLQELKIDLSIFYWQIRKIFGGE